MLFQTGMTFLQWNIEDELLKNILPVNFCIMKVNED